MRCHSHWYPLVYTNLCAKLQVLSRTNFRKKKRKESREPKDLMPLVQIDSISKEEALNSVSVLLQSIPEANKQFLCYLCKFLHKIGHEWRVRSIFPFFENRYRFEWRRGSIFPNSSCPKFSNFPFQEKTLMGPDNLALIFARNIIRPAQQLPTLNFTEVTTIMEIIMGNYSVIFTPKSMP